MASPVTAKTIFAFLGMSAVALVVSFGLLLVALLTGSAIWAWASPVALLGGLAAATLWLVRRTRGNGRGT